MNWKEKLGSRKLWTMLISVVTIMGAAFGLTEELFAQATAIITAGGIAMTYLFGQSKVDAAKEEHAETYFNINGMSKEEVAELVKGWMEANKHE